MKFTIIEAGNALLVQVVHRVRVFLAKDGDEHVGPGDFLLAIARGLHVHDGALDDALEAQRGLGVHLVGARHRGVLSLMKLASGTEGRRCCWHARSTSAALGLSSGCKQQMLHGDELVALLAASTKAMCKLTSSSWAIM